MILTIAEDFTNTVALDSELTSLPTGGMYLNSGVYSGITVNNLLQFLPLIDITFGAYDAAVPYGKYTDTRKVTDIVISATIMYQSIATGNLGNTPATEPTKWLATNIESLRIKSFVLRSQDAAIKKINLTRRLVDNQFLYNLVEPVEFPTPKLLPNDYAAFVFEPKGSDYTSFRINQIALQATTATPQSLYVINQGVLVTTLTLNPNLEGRLEFEDSGYVFSGKGKWTFAIDSQNVLTTGASIDPLRYDGFVVYTASGIGTTPQGATYSFGTGANGLNFNISVFLDSSVYVNNNLMDFGNYLQAAWEMDVLNMFLSNSNTRSNRDERNQMDRQMLIAETKDLKMNTVAFKFEKERKEALRLLGKTFDREINDNEEGLEIEISGV